MKSENSNRLSRPADAIVVTDYADLDRYIGRFADGNLNLVLLLGRPGIGKTEAVKRALGIDDAEKSPALYVEGHAQPFGLYQSFWRYRDAPVVLDDLDNLYAHPECVRLLKPLCNARKVKRVTWLSRAVSSVAGLPHEFATRSSVLLIANEWRSLNANVKALEDRAIILCFQPPAEEVHRKTADWFDDPEVYDFIGSYLSHIPELSMRYYDKGRRLRAAGFLDWKKSLLQMMLGDRTVAIVAGLQLDPRFTREAQRVQQFTSETGLSRATYFRVKARLPEPLPPTPLDS